MIETIKYKAVLFDLWGTLADLGDGLFRVRAELEAMLGEERWNIVQKHFVAWHRSKEDAEIFMRKVSAEVLFTDAEGRAVKDWIGYGNFVLFPDAREVLSWAKGCGFKLALVTNSIPSAREDIKRFGIAGYFDTMTFSFDVGFLKPEPAIFLHTIRILGCAPEEALMVGDSVIQDAEGAQAVGIHALLIDRNGLLDYPEKIKTLSELKQVLAV